MPFAATWMMDEPKDYHAKSSKSDRGRQMSYDIHMQNLKTDTNEHIYKQKQIHRHRKQTMATKGERGEGMNQEFGISRYKVLYIKQINNKVVLYSVSFNGKKNNPNHLAVHQKLTQYCKPAILQFKRRNP